MGLSAVGLSAVKLCEIVEHLVVLAAMLVFAQLQRLHWIAALLFSLRGIVVAVQLFPLQISGPQYSGISASSVRRRLFRTS